MQRHSLLLLFLLAAILLAGCATPVDPNLPPDIVYGEDVCDRCGMIISDERFAAGVVVERAPQEYEHLIFDDIGDMLAHIQEEGETVTIVSYFVHDYQSLEWLNAEDAVYVVSSNVQTPMGFGIAAFATQAAAEVEAAAWQGEIFDFERLRQQPVSMGHAHDSH